MQGLEEARLLLKMACKDSRALKGMLDEATFANEVFGFHAQQSVEKGLKAWMSLVVNNYPKTHDLELLLKLLEKSGQAVPEKFKSLIGLSDFAVQFRYEAFDDLEIKDKRTEIIQQVEDLLAHVESLVRGVEL